MVAPKIIRLFRMNGSNGNDRIYCRRHNRLYSSCPVKENLHLCECLSQCEMSLKIGGEGDLRRAGSN